MSDYWKEIEKAPAPQASGEAAAFLVPTNNTLKRRVQGAAGWLWAFTGLSVVNLVLAHFGLPIRMVFSFFATELAFEIGRATNAVLLGLALLLVALVLGFVGFLGFMVARYQRWANRHGDGHHGDRRDHDLLPDHARGAVAVPAAWRGDLFPLDGLQGRADLSRAEAERAGVRTNRMTIRSVLLALCLALTTGVCAETPQASAPQPEPREAREQLTRVQAEHEAALAKLQELEATVQKLEEEIRMLRAELIKHRPPDDPKPAASGRSPWREVARFNGDGDRTTASFILTKEARLRWATEKHLHIALRALPDDRSVDTFSSSRPESDATIYVYKPGKYYLRVSAVGAWGITVEEKR